MLRLCVVASVASFCVSFTLQAQSSAMHRAAKASISAADATLALFAAAAVGDRAAAVCWLAAGADPKAKNDDGKRPFQVAIDAEHDALTAILLKAAGGVNGRDEQGWTPLNWAILSGDWQLVQEFIRAGADIAAGHQSAWVVAKMMESERQLLEIVIAEQGVDAKIGWRDETLMMLAARGGHTEIVRMLIKGGADPNAKDGRGNSALLLAAEEGHTEIVAMLIEGGANLNANGWLGNSALILAVMGRHTEIVRMLIKGGADPNVRSEWGKASALTLAVMGRHTEIVRMLIKGGADPNTKDRWGGDSVLMLAAKAGHTEMVEVLVENGADLNARDFVNNTALDLAERFGYEEITAILRAAEQAAADGKH